MEPLFTIIFEDKSKYTGGKDYYKTGWAAMPKKKISSIFYFLPNEDHLVLCGYDKYYFYVEGVKDLNGKRSGELRAVAAYLFAKKLDKLRMYTIDLKTDSFWYEDIIEKNEIELTEKKLNSEFWRG